VGRRSRITEQNDGEREREYKRERTERYSASVEELAMESWVRGLGGREGEQRESKK
jgi:hypothetical protein